MPQQVIQEWIYHNMGKSNARTREYYGGILWGCIESERKRVAGSQVEKDWKGKKKDGKITGAWQTVTSNMTIITKWNRRVFNEND